MQTLMVTFEKAYLRKDRAVEATIDSYRKYHRGHCLKTRLRLNDGTNRRYSAKYQFRHKRQNRP